MKLKDFTLEARQAHQITNVKSDGYFYKISYNYLDFVKNTAEPCEITVLKQGGAKISLMLHLNEHYGVQ